MMGTVWEAHAETTRPIFFPAPIPATGNFTDSLRTQSQQPGMWRVLQPGNGDASPQNTPARAATVSNRLEAGGGPTRALANPADEAGAPAAPEVTSAIASAPTQSVASDMASAVPVGVSMPPSAAGPNRMAPGIIPPMMMPLPFMAPILWRHEGQPSPRRLCRWALQPWPCTTQ